MASLNKITLIGRLGKDVDLRYMSHGDAVANFSLATTEKWTDKQTGEKKEQIEWHQIVAFKKLGELCGHFLRKGSMIYCEGKLKTEKYRDKDGIEKYSTKIIINEMIMLDKKSSKDDDMSSETYAKAYSEKQLINTPSAPAALQPPIFTFENLNDEIPF